MSRTATRPGWRRAGSMAAATVLGLSVALGSMVAGIGVHPAGAAGPFTVNTTVDENLTNPANTSCVSPNGCSLRAAVEAANNSGGATINFASAGLTYDLSQSLGTLDFGNLNTGGGTYTINGNGSTVTAVQSGCPANPNNCFGVFSLDNNSVGNQSFDLNHLTISGGEVDSSGGGLQSAGGAGVLAGGPGDDYTFTNDTISGNTMLDPVTNGQMDGAGLSIGFGHTYTITGCTFSNNTASGAANTKNGGGLYLASIDGSAITATVTGSTFTNNTVADVNGGGGGLFIDNSTPGSGSSTVTVTGNTFSGNQATNGGGAAAGGGAILDTGGTTNIYSNNFLGNSVTVKGEGGAVNVVTGTANLAGNRFHANAAALATGQTLAADTLNSPSVSAEDNWWSSNTGPSAADLSGVSVTKYLQLRVSSSPNPVLTGSTTTVTADLTHDQTNTLFNAHLIPDGTPVTFGGTAGTYVGGTTGATTNGTASDAMTAGGGGVYTPNGITATVDGVVAQASQTVNQAPTITSADHTTFTSGTPGTFTVATSPSSQPVPTLSESGALPSGVTLQDNGNGTATLSGTPGAGTAGTYPITITASNGISPNASQSFTLTVNPAPATHFTVSAPASATAGVAFNYTVTALDAFNSTATGYTGTAHFTSSDGAAVLPADYTFVAGDNGVHTFSATLKTAGNQTITATDTATPSITGISNTVAVSGGTATHFTVSAPASATAGVAFNYTVTALDAFGNTDTGYTGAVHFTSSD
ncbi:MAG TPA: putative Ig domain-containing protein, partial [Acidimicrobiales bacterium]|nr:putative Ig domain-containing protein [Acidimicrobiales bacterium]